MIENFEIQRLADCSVCCDKHVFSERGHNKISDAQRKGRLDFFWIVCTTDFDCKTHVSALFNTDLPGIRTELL